MVSADGRALKSSDMWVLSTAVDVEFPCRRTWNCVLVSGFIRAVSTTAESSGGVALIASVLVSGATDCVKYPMSLSS